MTSIRRRAPSMKRLAIGSPPLSFENRWAPTLTRIESERAALSARPSFCTPAPRACGVWFRDALGGAPRPVSLYGERMMSEGPLLAAPGNASDRELWDLLCAVYVDGGF